MTTPSNLIFRLGDIVTITGCAGNELAMIIGGSFLGPPSFLGVLHVLSNNEILAIDPESINGIQFRSRGKEVEFQ